MTPEEIVERIARMTNPNKSSEPLDSEQALVRLIQECRGALSPRLTRQRARMYEHETAAYMHEMLRIERARAEDVRAFARDIVDILWGVGSGGSKRDPRRLDFGKEWDVEAIEEVALALSRCRLASPGER